MNCFIDYEEIEDLFKNQKYDTIWEKYSYVIETLLFIYSKDEFDDFIKENGCIEKASFLLELAAHRKICFALSVNDEMNLLYNYIQSESGITMNNDSENIKEK